MKKSQLKEIIKECIHEARMGGKRATSIGASKKVGTKACLFGKVDGKNCWIVKESERDYRAEYDNYHSSTEQKKNRAKRNTARSRLSTAGRVHKGDGMDVDHKNPLRSGGSNGNHNLRIRKKSANRAGNGH